MKLIAQLFPPPTPPMPDHPAVQPFVKRHSHEVLTVRMPDGRRIVNRDKLKPRPR